MKIVFIVFVIAAFAIGQSRQDQCHWRELDLCAATAVISLQNSPVAQTDEEIDQQCTYLLESLGCFHNYTDKCLTPLHREILSFVTDESEGNLKKFCTPGSEMRKNLLKHAECLAEAWKEQSSCINDVQAAVETLQDAESAKKITIACCTYQRFRQCGFDIVKSKCGEEAVEFINKLITFYVSELPNIVCTNYGGDSDKCTGVLPAPGTPPKGTNSNSVISRLISTYLGI